MFQAHRDKLSRLGLEHRLVSALRFNVPASARAEVLGSTGNGKATNFLIDPLPNGSLGLVSLGPGLASACVRCALSH